MPTRRKFLVNSIIGSTAVLSGCGAAASSQQNLNKPMVLSTWDFGLPANAEAWKVLEKGGRALDAVETGVKHTEADPAVQTVGYGGFPDRDGYVTLDACIMDDKYNCGSVMFLQNI